MAKIPDMEVCIYEAHYTAAIYDVRHPNEALMVFEAMGVPRVGDHLGFEWGDLAYSGKVARVAREYHLTTTNDETKTDLYIGLYLELD